MSPEYPLSKRLQRILQQQPNRSLLFVSVLAALMVSLLLGGFFFQQRQVVEPIVFVQNSSERSLFLMEREEGSWRYTAPVSLTLPSSWDRIQRLIIGVSVSGYYLPLEHAFLKLNETKCRFESDQLYLSTEDELELTPSSCSAPLQSGVAVQGTLVVEFSSVASIGIIGLSPPDGREIFRVGNDETPLYALGRFETTPDQNTARRSDQLSAIWHLPDFPLLLAGAILLAAILVCLGGVVLSFPALQLRRIIACGAFTLALGIVYSILVPPFQAPDEPDHFLAFSRIAQLPELEEGAQELARIGHFERIHFHYWERFLPEDIGAPYPVPWVLSEDAENFHVQDSGMESRSALTTSFWRALGPLFQGQSASMALLGLRVINAFLWAMASIIGALFIERLAPPDRRAFPLYLFFVPALPLFAVHVSNYSFYVQALTIAAGLGLALFLRGGRSNWGGLWLGTACSFLLIAATVGATMLAWAIAMVLARLLLAVGDKGITLRSAARYWFGLLIGFVPLLFFLGSEQFETLSRALLRLAALVGIPNSMAGQLDDVVVIGFLLVCAALGGLFLEYGVSRLAPAFRRSIDATAVWIVRAVAFLFAALLILSAFSILPQLPHRIPTSGALDYAALAIRNLLSLLTFRDPDLMFSLTFWTGFGWHDAFMADWLVRLLAGMSGVGLLIVMVGVFSAPDRSIRLLCHSAGVLCASILLILLITTGISGNHPNIHGRYLIGTYLLMLSVALAGLTPSAWLARRRYAPNALSPQLLRTSLEVLTVWGGLVSMCFCLFLIRKSVVHFTLDIHLLFFAAAFALGVSFATFGILVLWTRRSEHPKHTFLAIAPRPGFIYSLTAMIVCLLVGAELLVGLSNAVDYSLGYYIILVTAVAASVLWFIAPPVQFSRRLLAPAALLIGVLLHLRCILFLMTRYFG